MSNLNVTYMTQIAPGTAPAAGVAAAAGAPAADNPLGFLAALIDQMLAGGTDVIETQAGTEAGAKLGLPGLLNLAFDTKADTKVTAAPQGADLLAALTKQLDALQLQLSAGEAPAPAQLDQLKDAIASLSAAIEAPLNVPPVDADTALDPLQAIAAPVKANASLSDDQINQLLIDLGLIEPTADKPATPASVPAAKVEVNTDVAALRDHLLALSQSVAATAPDLSKKLEALADKLATVEAHAQLAAQLTPPAPQPDSDATTIAHIIRTLLGEPDRSDDAPKPDANLNAAVAASTQHADELLQVLAQLGLSTTAPSTTPPSAPVSNSETVAASAAVTATVPPPLLRLSEQLSKVSTALAATQPDLAKKLEAVASRMVSSDVDANLLGQLASAAKPGSNTGALDRLIQSLMTDKPVLAASSAPATTTQVAAAAKLDIPAPIAPTPTKSAVAEVKAAQPEPASVTADSAPAPQPRVSLAPMAREPLTHAATEPKIEAKAAVIADAVKTDTPAAANTPAQAAATAVAPQARPLPAAYQPVANPINMGQVAFEMVRQVHQGTSRFTIRLDPPELGRIDVKMHVDGTGAVHARLAVERPETLDLFQRDRQSLERALAQAGLDTNKTNLEFSLRQNHQNPFSGMLGGDQRHQHSGTGNGPRFSLNESDEIGAMPAVTLYRGIASAGGVNIVA